MTSVCGRWVTAGLALALSLLGCTTERRADERTLSSKQAVCDPAAIFGLESASDWSSSSGSLSTSTRRIQGDHSIGVDGGSTLSLQSAPACLNGGSYGKVSFYLSATAASATAPPVTLTVQLDSPSRGLNAAEVGSVELAGLGNGLFRRVELGLPLGVAGQLGTTTTDLRVTLTISSTSATQSFLVDGLSFDPATVVAQTGNPTENRLVTLQYLSSVSLVDTALYANAGLAISDRAQVVKPGNAFAPVVSTGGPATEVGVEAHVGNVASIPSVVLRDRSVVHGGITTAGTFTPGNDSSVTGDVVAGASLPLSTLSWPVAFQQSTEPLQVEPSVDTSAAPGAYAQVVVKPNAKLRLQTGTYYLQSLDVQASGELILSTSTGPVVIYVRDSVILRGILSFSGRAGDLLLVHLGSQEVAIDTTFSGVLVAPSADVRFGVGSGSHSGAAFAKFIRLDPQAVFTHQPALPLLAGPGAEACANLLVASAVAQTSSQAAYQEALFRYCGGSDAGPCETALMARINVDYYTAATGLLQDGMTTQQHLALLLDRERKASLFHGDETLACRIINDDPDGDFVPVPQDTCPNTPPLTATLENGCTDSTSPAAPPVEAVKDAIFKIGITGDSRCTTAPSPTIPSPFGAWRFPPDPSVGKALWISRDNDTSGCPIWYQLEGKLTDGSVQSIVFTAADDTLLPWIQKPANTLQFNVRTSDGGGRAAWASYTVWTDQYRARAFNAGGRRSAWSNWYRPGQEGCAAGVCSDF